MYKRHVAKGQLEMPGEEKSWWNKPAGGKGNSLVAGRGGQTPNRLGSPGMKGRQGPSMKGDQMGPARAGV